jgi:CRP-like cAMP-binding protein
MTVDKAPTQKETSNRILRSIQEAGGGLPLANMLEPVDLPLRTRLETPSRRIEHVYFLDDGLASVVVKGPGGQAIEAGIIGREGFTGIALLLGVEKPSNETIIQLAGHGHRLSASEFRRALKESRTLNEICHRYVHVMMTQMSYTAFANGHRNIEQRLARWLLMSEDRTSPGPLALTHEFLAVMLGVRRAGVTLAINILTRAGLVQRSRGKITIVDREGLIALAKGSYGPPEKELQRLF